MNSSGTRASHTHAFLRRTSVTLLALGLLACQKDKQTTEAEPDPSAWFAPASASGLTALPEPEASAETEAPAKVDDDGIVEAPVRRVRPKDMPVLPPAPTERGADPKTASIDAVMGSYGFPVHKSLKHLCAGRVLEGGGGGGYTQWDAFTSSEAPSALLTSYTSRLGEKGYSDDKSGGTWRLPAGSKSPTRVLSILAVTDGGPHKGCDAKPPEDAKSVIIASRRH